MIQRLPKWVLTGTYPVVYDSESVTAIEMVAKLYGKMEELVTDYNKFVDQINKHIDEYETEMKTTYEEFRQCIIETMNDYIQTIDTKINQQDTKIQEAIDYMKDNITETASDLFEQALLDGDIQAELENVYNAETESLTIRLKTKGE